jgi:hypothetical protein
MISTRNVMKSIAVLSILSFSYVFGTGCSTSKEAMASTPQATPVPAVDMKKIESAIKRVESAASLAEAAAKKAELSAINAEIAVGKAGKSADRAEKAAEKAESIFMRKMKK